jgi:lipid II:glycine glycyltransferase (peptidoglycan interpeptide bridge formation enzyme)
MQYYLKKGLNEQEKERLSSFVKKNPYGNLYQHPLWPSTFNTNTLMPFLYFWGEESGDIKVSALIRRHRVPVLGWAKDTISRGPVCANANVLNESISYLVNILKAKGSTSLKMNPYWSYPEAKEVENVLSTLGFSALPPSSGLHSHTLIVDLQKSENDIYKSFRRFTRERLKKAEKIGMTVSSVQNEDEVHEFWKLYNKLATEKQLRNISENYFIRLWHTFLEQKTNGIFLITRYEQEIVSGLIVMKHNNRAVATISASEHQKFPKAPKSQPNHWHAILWAKNNKCTLYDLGGYLPNAPKGSPLDGVNQFKIGFSKLQDHLICEHENIFHPTKYRFLSRIEDMVRR